MNSEAMRQVPGTCGSKAIGSRKATITSGSRAAGNSRLTRARIGVILITTIISRDGNFMKATGTTKIMTMVTGMNIMTMTTATVERITGSQKLSTSGYKTLRVFSEGLFCIGLG